MDLRRFLIICALGALVSCSDNATMLQAGVSRPAISPADVKIYLVAPEKYEAIGMVNASDSSHFLSNQKLQKRILADIKIKAARVGANGVLITHTGSGEVAGNTMSIIGSLSSDGQSMTALAIYVPPLPPAPDTAGTTP
jgi:hypothetical protein